MPRSRRRPLGPTILIAALAAVLVPPTANAALVTLQYRPTQAAPPAPADLTPIAPFDAAWNPPTPASSGNPRGNVIPRTGDPSATTTDFVEFARTVPQGIDEVGPLRGSIMVDFDKLEPGLPAVVAIHGGMVAGPPCSPTSRRLSQTSWARLFAAKGYIVFLPDFTRPTNDKKASFLGWLLRKGKPGDCMADDGWEPSAKRAQISLQLSVRSLKTQLARFAAAHPGTPAGEAFAAASDRVVAFGGSSGGHMAARLALRSEDSSGAPGDGPQLATERRVAGAVAIDSIGECTRTNGARNARKVYGLDSFAAPAVKAFAGCGPVAPDALDSPVKFFNGLSSYRDWTGKWRKYTSPITGSGGWGPQIGWDGVVDARWSRATCDDLGPALCTFETFPVAGLDTHYIFPHNARPPGAPKNSPTYWESTVFPKVDAFYRATKSDAQAAAAAGR